MRRCLRRSNLPEPWFNTSHRGKIFIIGVVYQVHDSINQYLSGMKTEDSLFYIILTMSSLLISCNSVSTESGSSNTPPSDSEWLVPEDQIFAGAGRDDIPSIDNPSFLPVEEITFLADDELILGIKIDGVIKGYPHQILNYHEIVNDRVSGTPVALTFCPLSGSGMAWNRVVNGTETTFGVSGLIHKNNLIAYDRVTNNFWSQMKEMSINGSLKGEKTESYQVIEMNWETWKEAFPESLVLSGETGFDRNYTIYPYGRNYSRDNNYIIFPIHREDERLERKTLAHGIFYDSDLHVFPVEYFPETMAVINRKIAGRDVVIAGSSSDDLVISYSSVTKDGTTLNFTVTEQSPPALMEDTEGNVWNYFGEAVSGPRTGEKLNRIPSYNAYWFAWADFFGQDPKTPTIVAP